MINNHYKKLMFSLFQMIFFVFDFGYQIKFYLKLNQDKLSTKIFKKKFLFKKIYLRYISFIIKIEITSSPAI